METLLGLLVSTVLGAAGWWLGERIGIMTAFMVSTVASGVGLYAGRRFFREYLD
jgi:hypothetical protein